MADPPRRDPSQPPPLPLRVLPPRPQEPFVDLTADPQPDTVRTSGRVPEMLPPPSALTSPIEHRDLVAALRQALAQAEGQAPVSSVPPPLSRRQVAARWTGKAAQWVTLAVGVLGIAAQVAAIFRPDLVGPIQTVIQLLGGRP